MNNLSPNPNQGGTVTVSYPPPSPPAGYTVHSSTYQDKTEGYATPNETGIEIAYAGATDYVDADGTGYFSYTLSPVPGLHTLTITTSTWTESRGVFFNSLTGTSASDSYLASGETATFTTNLAVADNITLNIYSSTETDPTDPMRIAPLCVKTLVDQIDVPSGSYISSLWDGTGSGTVPDNTYCVLISSNNPNLTQSTYGFTTIVVDDPTTGPEIL